MGYDVVQAFTAALKTRKLFGVEHQNTQKSTDNFVQRMTALANKAGQTKLNIQPGGLLMFNEPILTVQKPQDSPLFPLLLDGIGGLSFNAGILPEELPTLLETVSSSTQTTPRTASYHFVEANLPHIELLKLPALGSGFGNRAIHSSKNSMTWLQQPLPKPLMPMRTFPNGRAPYDSII